MAREVQFEHTLGRRELILLERLVRVLEKSQGVEVPLALHTAIGETHEAAQQVKDAIQSP